MRRGFLFLLTVLSVVMFAAVSCDKAHSTSDGRIQGVYTVYGNTLLPERTDTFYTVGNMREFDLKHGDRAIITLAYEIDNLVGAQFAKWSIQSVDEKLVTHSLTPKGDVDATEYSSVIDGPADWSFFMYGKYWLWNKYQNFYIQYYSDGTKGDFKLSPVGMSGDTLCFELNSKFVAGDKANVELLTFDGSDAYSMLSTEEAAKLLAADSIYTKITTKVNLVEQDTVVMYTYGGGKYKKTF